MICCSNFCFAQSAITGTSKTLNNLKKSIQPTGVFIENIGQYGTTMAGYENMGAIKYGYEGLDMPVLFTTKGLIHLQRKITKLTHNQEEKLEKQGLQEDEIERK